LDAKAAQTVVVELRHVATSPPLVKCTWLASDPTVAARWVCSPVPDNPVAPIGSSTETQLYFTIENAHALWLITVIGPSGTQALERVPFDDTGDALPSIQCSCSLYSLRLSATDLQAVGAKTP
jgi:hypothetical protein